LAKDGTYGIFLAVNDGTNPQNLANAETAQSLSSLAFDETGEFLYFAADHGTHHHLHQLHLREGLETFAESSEPISRIVSSQFGDGNLAFRQGSCAQGTKVVVRRFRPPPDAGPELVDVPAIAPFVEPAGWLPGNRLLLIARQSGCDEAGDLHLWTGGTTTELLAENVDRAAIRVASQGPPPPPPIPGAGVA
jgi:hypothetical protein